jgi:threonine dehydrogenase-like Zn-dependent dehydrogenase
MMKAPVLRDGTLSVREVPIPTPGPGQILVRTNACGICASDLHFMEDPQSLMAQGDGLWNYVPGADFIMGHEFCGEIVEYGPDTERKWKVGTRVSSVPVLITPAGVRITGYSPDAPGAMGQYFLMSEAVTQEVRSDLPSEHIATSDAMAVGWYYVKRAAVGPREIPLVIGCGAIGLSVVAALRHRGIGPIVAVDFSARRRQVARQMGADVVIDPAAASPYAGWRELAYGDPNQVRGIFDAVDLPRCVAFECVGVEGVLDGIVVNCERDTRIFSAGCCPSGDHIHSAQAHQKGISIQFGGGPQMPDWNEALQVVASGAIDATPLVGDLIGIEDVPGAMGQVKSADSPARIIILPNGKV